jgi:hypothetical protein
MAAALLGATESFAGEKSDTTYKVVVYAGLGGSLLVTEAGTPSGLQADVSTFGPAGTFRVMWRPDHLLGVGIETGWSKLYSYETSGDVKGSVYLSQVPLYAVFSMKLADPINVFGGYGYSRLTSELDYGGTTKLGTWSMGWIAACTYERPINEKLGLAAELKWINAVEAKVANITLQVQLVYDLLEY